MGEQRGVRLVQHPAGRAAIDGGPGAEAQQDSKDRSDRYQNQHDSDQQARAPSELGSRRSLRCPALASAGSAGM